MIKNVMLKLGIGIFLLSLVNCGTQSKEMHQKIEFELIESQSQGGYKLDENIVISNSIDLKLLYTKLNLSRKPGLPIPDVDFEKESIIAVFMGEKLTGGYAISIESISKVSKSSIEVKIKETNPGDMATMAITSPFAIYKVSISNAKTTFIK